MNNVILQAVINEGECASMVHGSPWAINLKPNTRFFFSFYLEG